MLINSAGTITIIGLIIAGSGPTTLTTTAGLLRHQAIDPDIAGSGLSVSSGVLSVDSHAPAAHTIVSHSDTTATVAELDTLTDNSIANALHRHSELVASDGSPDPALSVDADGNLTAVGTLASGALTVTGTINATGNTTVTRSEVDGIVSLVVENTATSGSSQGRIWVKAIRLRLEIQSFYGRSLLKFKTIQWVLIIRPLMLLCYREVLY